MNGSKVGIGFFYPVAAVLVVLSAFGNGLKAAMMIFIAKRSDYQENIQLKYKKIELKELAKKHNDFPKYRAQETFINAISQGLLVLMLIAFFLLKSCCFYTIIITDFNIILNLICITVILILYITIKL